MNEAARQHACLNYFGMKPPNQRFVLPPVSITMEVPLALDLRAMDQIRYGTGRCLVCGRRAELDANFLWGNPHVQRLAARAQRWLHHRKCKPWVITRVEHTWSFGLGTTEITAKGIPPRFSWWDRLLGRPRFVEPKILQYTIDSPSPR